ncbi:benzoate/H(+) symporter BenE family transporter [Archangium sp.]|uniref:benzoate/H(+) symporter BenE family transporter n=1 Tax=Archangium sp. TaxID=1872627 RepID=UPI002D313829|nr:benzoate/H(+) symporter BenE family transporter [Archangium sp.]HYO58765.1 benzoate/H(+) symporter BenE family transporter [Archangium sp.]
MTTTPRPALIPLLTAGFVTVLVGFTSSYPLVLQAGQALGLTRDQLVLMTSAFALGTGLTTLLPSLWLRMPIVTAWSTPGAALLAVSLQGVELPEAVGAFVICGALLFFVGMTPLFGSVLHYIPQSLASALLAGVLVKFGLEAFASLRIGFAFVAPMLATYLIARRFISIYAVPLVLVVGVVAAALAGALHWTTTAAGSFPRIVAVAPTFSWTTLIGIALPLFVVTMASQNLPGVAVLRTHGYAAPVSRLVALTGLATMVLAPFGVFALNLAAITAALCMGDNVHPDPGQRYRAAVVAGSVYCLVGVAGIWVVDTFTAFPRPLVIAIAGFALLPTIARGLSQALEQPAERESALITFLVTASGLELGGIGAAFWGVVLGIVSRWLLLPSFAPKP